ncbi:MAG: biotin attachment protein [Candidatus Melainabacteria bacterium]|nr:MAG: biotin attachment protein [Candidatus Melainabacteria bacterium]RAI13899.1 MAG: biotin attachment protein [Candidatus Melainabacteria bacterium]
MSKKLINVMDTSFRDGFQSVFGARVLVEDFLPALKSAVDAGIKHFEVAGGARFQAPIFFCNENAFETMDKIRETVGPDIKLQSLARGVNVVGLNSQPRDVIDLHAKMFAKHGVNVIRNFDALNDVNNLIDSANSIKKYGLQHEVTITMMELPYGCEGAHDVEFYKQVLRNILDAGIPFDSLAFKDASGTSHPRKVYDTVKMAREMLGADMPIRFHSHETAGTGLACYLAALDAGADGIDLSMKPVSGGTAQPDIISMWHALRGTEYDLGLDIKKIMETEEIFKDCMKDYNVSPVSLAVNPILIQAPLPGGATATTIDQLKDMGMLDKFPKLIENMKEVVSRGGFGTSVTPVSQFYAQQSFLNAISEHPWEKANPGYAKMILGYFGKTPCEPDPELVKWAEEKTGLQPTTEKVVDINDKDPEKGLKAAEERLKAAGLPVNDENLFIAAACKDGNADKGIDFLLGKGHVAVNKGQKATKGNYANGATVTVNGKEYAVKIDGDKATVNGKTYDVSIAEGMKEVASASSSNGAGTEVKSPLPGAILKVIAREGDMVEEGDVLILMEAMKMETEIKAPCAGKVGSVRVDVGATVTPGQLLVTLG